MVTFNAVPPVTLSTRKLLVFEDSDGKFPPHSRESSLTVKAGSVPPLGSHKLRLSLEHPTPPFTVSSLLDFGPQKEKLALRRGTVQTCDE